MRYTSDHPKGLPWSLTGQMHISPHACRRGEGKQKSVFTVAQKAIHAAGTESAQPMPKPIGDSAGR